MEHAAQQIMNAAQLMAEIEAMKVTNNERERRGLSPAYNEDDFIAVAQKWYL